MTCKDRKANQHTHWRSGRIRSISDPSDRPWTRPYDRLRDLPRLLPITAQDVATDDIEGCGPAAQKRLLVLLRRSLRAERMRARQGHWTYDPARHSALLRAYRIESERFAEAADLKGLASSNPAHPGRT